MTTYFSKRAFTLIELLIVVAIIAILAAIAVPNFLEAQTRSKVARVKNDHRTYALAMEAYVVDHNTYPGDQDNNPLHPTERAFYKLTTPISYINTLFSDPFSQPTNFGNPNDPDVAAFYVCASGADNGSGIFDFPSQNFVLIGIGPDGEDSSDNQDNFPGACFLGMYDPTNGTLSDGDILRFGGAYRVGVYRLGGNSSSTPGVRWNFWNLGTVIPE